MSRNYKKEYANFQGKPEQIHKRSLRNSARRKMIKAKGIAAVRGKDVDHKKGVSAGNGMKNLRVLSVHNNRSYARTKTGGVKARRK